MLANDDKPRKLPRPFRASTNPRDGDEHARLLINDDEQKALGERVNAPFTPTSPLDAARSKAFIAIETLANTEIKTPEVLEQIAEAYATIGQYDIARDISEKNSELYEKYWQAVWLADDEWCAHPEKDKYIKEYVYSVKENREMPLLACNICRTWNVLDAPYSLKEREASQASLRGSTADQSIEQARAWHDANVKRRAA